MSVYGGEFALNDESCVVEIVGAGRKSDNVVVNRDVNVRRNQRLHTPVVEMAGEIILRLEEHLVGVGLGVGGVGAEYLDLVVLDRGVEIHDGVLVVVFLIIIIAYRGEHRAVVHVVPVENCVLAGKVAIAGAVEEERAGSVIRPVDEPVQVIEVVLSLHDGVVDNGVLRVQPADNVLTLVEQRVKVDVNGRAFGYLIAVAAVIVFIFALFRGNVIAAYLVICILRDLVLMQRGYQLIAAVHEYQEEYDAENNKHYFYRLLQRGRPPVC